MTIMFDRYFGIPQHVMRSGLWAQMKPSEQSLYVCLMHESERYSSRQLRRKDAVLCQLTGLSTRACCNARKKLQEHGLVICARGSANIYVYTLCNPETARPWPGDPKQQIRYCKKGTDRGGVPSRSISSAQSAVPTAQPIPAREPFRETCEPQSIRAYGLPLKF